MPTPTDALTALADGDWSEAAELATAAAADHPGSALATALSSFLAELPGAGVYDEPSGFEAFIGNAGNVHLYDRTIGSLARAHAALDPRSVLDIGCGDGRVTAASLGAAATHVDLVEPSASLLHVAAGAVARPGLEVVAHQAEVVPFLDELDERDDPRRWDVVQSTFALHTTRPEDRPALLAALARRTTTLLVVDFDVPAFADRSPEHVAYLAERYELGIREYAEHPAVVRRFLLPVLVGQLDPSRPRYTFEQPTDAWADLFRSAGFTTSVAPVSTYWWAEAMLLTATASPASSPVR